MCFAFKTQAQVEQKTKKNDPSNSELNEPSKSDSLIEKLLMEHYSTKMRNSININHNKNEMPNFLESTKGNMPIWVPDGCFGGILIAKVPEDFHSNMPIKKFENYK